MYKLVENKDGEVMCIKRIDPCAFIPFDPANTDYQAYLKWLEEGNEPLPAEQA